MKLKVFILFLTFLLCSCAKVQDGGGYAKNLDKSVIKNTESSSGKEFSFDNKINSEASFYGSGNSVVFSTVRVLSKFKSYDKVFSNSVLKTQIKSKKSDFLVFMSSRFIVGFYLYFLCVMRN